MGRKDSQLRLLIAGDKSHCGKSTISLGLLASLLEIGFAPGDLAYIKPATQCVSDTLTAKYCESAGIAYVHIGPVVFYRGFTREFLDGHHGTSAALLDQCTRAVDKIGEGKKVVIIDGVGYPSVGSIVGCSSVDIALACRAPVLLVGKSGVGDAVDSFNLCATYFERRGVPVLGGVFNKLPTKGLYSRDKCAEYVGKYFAQARPTQNVYGFIPKSETLGDLGAEETCGFSFSHPNPKNHVIRVKALEESEAKAVAAVVELFRQWVDVKAIVHDVQASAPAVERALTRHSTVGLLSADPSALMRNPFALAWVAFAAISAHIVHALLNVARYAFRR